jgi:hypothetical protein
MSSATLTNSAPRSTALRLSYQRNEHSKNSAKHYPWPKELVKLLEDARHIVIQMGCTGEGQVSDRLRKNFGQRLKCGEHKVPKLT